MRGMKKKIAEILHKIADRLYPIVRFGYETWDEEEGKWRGPNV